jgi:hypothetical protein
MSTKIVKHNQNEIAPRDVKEGDAACAAYAAETQASGIAGDILLCKKGVWVRGEHKDTVPAGDLFLANMPEIHRGSTRWDDNKPVEHRVVRIGDGHPPGRNELGHHDESKWEIGNDGKLKDPWTPTDRMVMREAGDVELSLLTFITSSFGGRKALGNLCREYANRAEKYKDHLPVVRLGKGAWQHKKHGDIPVPVFEVVGWEPWDVDKAAPADAPTDDVPTNLGPPKDGPEADDASTSFS